jgi:hypothetical protein
MKNREDFVFLPYPRSLTWDEGTLALENHRLIALNADTPQALRFAAGEFQAALDAQFDLRWELVGGNAVPAEQVGLTLIVLPEAVPHPEGYHLTIAPDGIVVQAHDPAGIFYAICTLKQLLSQLDEPALPRLEIDDWPDFPSRGVMLDISRDKVPTMETLFALVDRLASWKVNEFQLYTEHTFAYRDHRVVWKDASPMTAEQILALDAYCRERFVELVPNQNSFGHMRRWLEHKPYEHLAENLGEFPVPWGGTRKGPFSLSPAEPGSLELVRSLYDELLPNFTSRTLNVGCDETWDLGSGKSKALCEERGKGRVYLDFLLQIYEDVTRRDYTMQFWGDIIIQHPELVPELPRDAIALEWGYDAKHPFDEHGAQFAAAGVPFYVCPGTSSWNTIAGRTENALGNLKSAAENGLKHGATGYLNTDWGDNGHWQHLPISYLGFGMGAAYSWCLSANEDVDVAEAISRFAFDDSTGAMGRVAYNLGNIYRELGYTPHNSSVLFWILQQRYLDQQEVAIEPEVFKQTLNAINEAIAPLDEAEMSRRDAALIKREFKNAAHLLRHACKTALWQMGKDEDAAAVADALAEDLEAAIEEYKKLWLTRNRSGGLKDSLAHFEKLRAVYKDA